MKIKRREIERPVQEILDERLADVDPAAVQGQIAAIKAEIREYIDERLAELEAKTEEKIQSESKKLKGHITRTVNDKIKES